MGPVGHRCKVGIFNQEAEDQPGRVLYRNVWCSRRAYKAYGKCYLVLQLARVDKAYYQLELGCKEA